MNFQIDVAPRFMNRFQYFLMFLKEEMLHFHAHFEINQSVYKQQLGTAKRPGTSLGTGLRCNYVPRELAPCVLQ